MNLKVHNFTRDNLVEHFAGKGVEVGTCWGRYAKTLCKSNPELELFTVDPYRVIYQDKWTETIGQEDLEKIRSKAKKVLKQFNCKMIRKSSMEAVRDFENESIDFVYIDGSHQFDYVITDLVEWGRKVKKGGIILGHDYNLEDVKRAVDSYIDSHEVAELNLTDEKSPSWWFKRTW